MIHVDIRYCQPEGIYYLQVQTSAYKTAARRQKELRTRLSREALPDQRDEYRMLLAESRREQTYSVDFIPLQPADIPAGARIRTIKRRPPKVVTVETQVYRWLLQKLNTGAAADEEEDRG